MRRLLFALPLLLAGCQASLQGQPTWLALGREIYQERDLAAAEAQPLAFVPEARWFVGLPREVSTAEFEAARTHASGDPTTPERFDGRHFLPNPPPYPQSLTDIPRHDHGVRLALRCTPATPAHPLTLDLTLTTDTLPVYREVEHRFTNTLPFLFALFIDGHPLTIRPRGFGKFGGIESMMPLATPGHPRRWHLVMDAESLWALLPDRQPHTITIVAAFANSQHLGRVEGDSLPLSAFPPETRGDTPLPPPLLVRSNAGTFRIHP
jgi:hypothetical protein